MLTAFSGCAEKDLKFTYEQNPDRYVQFNNDEGKTAFYHSGGVENVQGTWIETDTDYTMFLSDGSSLVFTKLDNGSIGMRLDDEDASDIAIYKRV